MELYAREFDRDSIVSVRHDVEQLSERAGLSGFALYRFVVAVNEIVTNAVRHGGGRGRLRLWRDGQRLHCQVTDSGPGMADPKRAMAERPAPETVGGWGLWLARQGSEGLVVDTGTRGSAITLTHSLTSA
jgi:anti-sigma regulatory factor (Ser/Thr protein kinase)